jgi:hypothetical protein
MPEPLSPFRRLVIAEPGTVRIEVRRGSESSLWAVVDIEDLDLVGRHKWWANERGDIVYAHAGSLYMHRLVLQVPDDMVVDHIDHDGLNNRRANLRSATLTQNSQHRRALTMRAGRPVASRFKGVTRSGRMWQVSIQISGHRLYLGQYSRETDAAQMYDRYARAAFGEYAVLNFPD